MKRPLLLLTLLLAPVLAGCRYNFVPLIPPAPQIALPTRITQAELRRDGETLRLQVTLDGRLEPGYLQVSWFDSSREIGADSVYLDAETRSATLSLSAPEPGAYRAVLSFGGTVLRQVERDEVKP